MGDFNFIVAETSFISDSGDSIVEIELFSINSIQGSSFKLLDPNMYQLYCARSQF